MIPEAKHPDPWPAPAGFHVVTVGTSVETPRSSYGPWRLPLWGLAWIADGGGVTTLDDQRLPTRAGTVIAMRPGMVLRHDWGEARSIHCFVVFGFTRLRPPWPEPASWPLVRQLQDEDFLLTLWRYLLRLDPERDAMLTTPMVELILRFFLTGAGGRPASLQAALPPAVDRALSHIQRRSTEAPAARLTLAELARAARVSPQHLSRLFAEHLGVTPIECALAYRVEHAATVLERTERGLADIASEYGFSSAFHFSRAFKRCYGVAPSEYRRGFKEQTMTRPTGLLYRNHRLRRYFYEAEPGRILV